jgi:hypothetical protein
MTKGKKTGPSRKREAPPFVEVCKEVALLYIQKLKREGVEPSVKSIAKQYLLTEEIVVELLAKELIGPDNDVISPRH